MGIVKKNFGFMQDDGEVFSYLLDNGNVKTEIISYGDIIKNLWIRDKSGRYIDVVLITHL